MLSPEARCDIREALIWSAEKFGERAERRYRALLKRALADIAADPEGPGSHDRPELGRGIRIYHLSFSTGPGLVQRPRHFVIYRRRDRTMIDVVRVLHDSRDLKRHLLEHPGKNDD